MRFLHLAIIILLPWFLLPNELWAVRNNHSQQTNKSFNKSKHFYTDQQLCEFASKFTLDHEVLLTGVKFMVASEDSIGSLRLRIYGNEGGANFPRYMKDLIQPIKVSKTKNGIQEIELKLEVPIIINEASFFISFDSLSSGLNIVTSKNEIPCNCFSSKSGYYYSQSIKNRDGKWFLGKYKFVVQPLMNPIAINDKNYFSNVDLQEDLKIRANSISTADLNKDGLPELIVNGKIFKNNGNFKYEASNQPKHTDSVFYHTMIDIDADGDLDIVAFTNRDSVTKELKVVLYKNLGQDFESIALDVSFVFNPKTIAVGYINTDEYPDLAIAQEADTSLNKSIASLILINDKNLSFKSHKLDFANDDSINTSSSSCALYDKDNDGYNELILLNDLGETYIFKVDDDRFTLFSKSITDDIQDLTNEIAHPTDISIHENLKGDELTISTNLKRATNEPNNTYIFERNTGSLDVNKIMSNLQVNEIQSGVCVFDINNDGFQDIITLTNDSCRRPQSYIKLNDTTYKTITLKSGLNCFSIGPDAIAEDLDNDGKMDLLTFDNNYLVIYKNTYNEVESENTYVKIIGSSINNIKNIHLIDGDTIKTYSMKANNGKGFQTANTSLTIGLGKKEKLSEAIIETSEGDFYGKKDLLPNNHYSYEDFLKSESKDALFIDAWPSPFYNSINIRVLNGGHDYSLSIKDGSGKILLRKEIKVGLYQEVYIWNGMDQYNHEVSNGIYFIEIECDKVIKILKVVKVN